MCDHHILLQSAGRPILPAFFVCGAAVAASIV